jgi:hypothetical protein
MPLTAAQRTILRTDVQADVALNALPHNSDSLQIIIDAYSLDASPVFWVWRTSVSKMEYVNSTSVDGTVFSYVGTGFITRSAGEQAAWRDMFDNAGNVVNPSLPQVRQAFLDIFSGAVAPAPANRAHLATMSRRRASRLEKLFVVASSGPGTGTGALGATGNPGALVVEGVLSYSDADQMWTMS